MYYSPRPRIGIRHPVLNQIKQISSAFVFPFPPVACTAALYSTDYERVEESNGLSLIFVASLQSASWAVHAALVVAVAMGRMDNAAIQYANRLVT